MRRYPLPILIVFALLMSSQAWSASSEDARQLHEEGRTEEALAMIESVLGSGAAAAEKAAALDLLGAIAVDEGQLAMAKQAWSRLLSEYPDYAASHDTATKFRLVSALLRTEESPTAAGAVEEEATEATAGVPIAEVAVEPEEPPGESTSAPAPPATAPVPRPSEPEAKSAPSPTPAPSPSSDLVLVAARGKPHDAVKIVSDRVVAFLRDNGVNAESATGGIPVVSESKMVLPMLLQKGQQDGVASVLLLTADYVSMQKMVLDCYLPEGSKLWKFKVSGGTGTKGRPYSKTGVTEALAERFLEKLGEKVGEPGLPVTLQ